MKRMFTCIVCPNGCDITLENGEIEGALCAKGKEYVQSEMTNPQRTIATSILVENGELPLASVRLSTPIPKAEIFRVMGEINKLRLSAPVCIGQVAIENVCGLGSDVIITKNIACKESM